MAGIVEAIAERAPLHRPALSGAGRTWTYGGCSTRVSGWPAGCGMQALRFAIGEGGDALDVSPLLAGDGRVATPAPQPDDLVEIAYTSGTTGRPKGAIASASPRARDAPTSSSPSRTASASPPCRTTG